MDLQGYPLLNLGTAKKPALYPMEMVEIQPGQNVKAKLTGEETTAMLAFACRTPYENAISINNEARDVLGYDDNETLAAFGVSVGKKLAAVEARVLNTPAVAYLNASKKPALVTPNFGAWNMRSVRVVKPGRPISRWTYINVLDHPGGRQIPATAVKEFVGFIHDGLGVQINPQPITNPKPFILREAAVSGGLDKFFSWAQGQGIQYIFFILAQRDSTGLYTKIKRLGDCTHGIQTSCVLARHLLKERNLSYYANVGLKVNLKAGGVNHRLKDDFGLLKEGKTMFVGYDVTHPTNMPTSSSAPSIVGLVSSIDQDLAQWPAMTWEQEARQEILNTQLVDAFESRIELWQKHNGNHMPQNIVIFRDGVSEGQFAQVVENEIPMIRAACSKRYTATKQPMPKLSLIISVKRHQTRFYPSNAEEMSRSGNIRNGTVVDRGITLAPYWDFYLTAHDALQGTARPAHYTVLLDEVFRHKCGAGAANELERLTHELCYLFGRATKAVSICPPAYYADIVCERARSHRPEFDSSDAESIATSDTPSSAPGQNGRQVHPALRDTMYYI